MGWLKRPRRFWPSDFRRANQARGKLNCLCYEEPTIHHGHQSSKWKEDFYLHPNEAAWWFCFDGGGGDIYCGCYKRGAKTSIYNITQVDCSLLRSTPTQMSWRPFYCASSSYSLMRSVFQSSIQTQQGFWHPQVSSTWGGKSTSMTLIWRMAVMQLFPARRTPVSSQDSPSTYISIVTRKKSNSPRYIEDGWIKTTWIWLMGISRGKQTRETNFFFFN